MSLRDTRTSPIIHSKKPCIHSKEPHTRLNQPTYGSHSKKPCIYSKRHSCTIECTSQDTLNSLFPEFFFLSVHAQKFIIYLQENAHHSTNSLFSFSQCIYSKGHHVSTSKCLPQYTCVFFWRLYIIKKSSCICKNIQSGP